MSLENVIKPSYYIVMGLIIITGFFLLNRFFCNKPKTVDISAPIENPLLLKQVDSLRDANGKLYARLEQKVYTQAQVNHLLDSVAKVLGIRVRTIKGVDKITIKIDTVYKDLPVKRIYVYAGDSAYRVERHDGWNDIIAVAGRDSGSIVYRARDTLTRIEVAKNPIFGPSKRYIYQTNSNPALRITNGAAFTIKEKQAWLSVGPYGGYDVFNNRASFGIGVMVPLINLKK